MNSRKSISTNDASVRPGKPRRSVIGDQNATDVSASLNVDMAPIKETSRPNSARVADYMTREVIKPEDQAQLSQEQLDSDLTRILTAKNRNAPGNITRYSYKERMYKAEPSLEQLQLHYTFDGCSMHKESEEAKKHESYLDAVRQSLQRMQQEQAMMHDAEIQADDDPSNPANLRALRNQFNFNERASQTYSNAPKHRTTCTEPPPLTEFSATVTQWEIFDAYMENEENKRIQKEKAKAQQRQANKDEDGEKKDSKDSKEGQVEEEIKTAAVVKNKIQTTDDVLRSHSFQRAVKVMERMVNQNTYSEITQDFKYWDDPSDAYREGEGSLLPLWKFSFEKAKRRAVTSVVWNPEYYDLFVVGYGSYDFLKPTSGLIACFSLKNPSYPEFYFSVESGVMALDFHPQYSSLLAVGLYDGRVMVFDIHGKSTQPIFQSTAATGKHTDPVWQIKWEQETTTKELNFFSVSSDGRVTLWSLAKNELEFNDIMELKYIAPALRETSEGEEDPSLFGLSGGCSFDFNRFNDHLFVVGTEEGHIHKCSKAYNSQYLETYEGHNMAVYGLKWNTFHPRVFLSCSADWSVKMWEHNHKHPVLSFDLNNAVGSVAWAPFSSTIFAAVTADGKVHIFDVHQNKNEAICEQPIVRKSKLTQLAFNYKQPILLVGDDRGTVSCLKLSPNLRQHGSREEEMEKMEKILNVAFKGDSGSA
eukprot:TRINITY_DN3272_c0_g1_i1.p1 TRINITY_DN3272_c0_g1~~TRINITY_DN3272_c0_g1_i1.p1  ORF type:complete len:703 (-),score=170.86 TRINITY_DN3272_c0_g1_i1:294-2402(-)